jgi:dTDP-4-dehydrorhamnose 3,5-epimerase
VRLRATAGRLPRVRLIEPAVHADSRGFFLESYRQDLLADAGIHDQFVQDNHSRSRRGIVRGMHFQPGMAKLVRCVRGAIYDVVVNIQVDSPTFGRWEGFELTDVNHHQVYCPDGYAHGFCVLSPEADVVYKTSAYWNAAIEGGFVYGDPQVGIGWPDGLELTASDKDATAPPLSALVDRLRETQAAAARPGASRQEPAR